MALVDASANAIAGMLGGQVAMLLMWPLENIRLKLQTTIKQKAAASSASSTSTASTAVTSAATSSSSSAAIVASEKDAATVWGCIQQILREDGVAGLFKGLQSALVGVTASQLVFFYLYALLKYLQKQRGGQLGPLQNLIIASVAGAINCVVTNPIWVVNTRITLQKKDAPEDERYSSIWDCFVKIYRKQGSKGFFSGLSFALMLVSNPAIQFVVYEQITRMMLNTRSQQAGKAITTLTSTEYFVLGAAAKAVATLCTYPLLSIKSRIQAGHSTGGKSSMQLILDMLKNEGFASFYSGISAKFVQTVLNAAFMFATYESFLRLAFWLIKGSAAPSAVPAKA